MVNKTDYREVPVCAEMTCSLVRPGDRIWRWC